LLPFSPFYFVIYRFNFDPLTHASSHFLPRLWSGEFLKAGTVLELSLALVLLIKRLFPVSEAAIKQSLSRAPASGKLHDYRRASAVISGCFRLCRRRIQSTVPAVKTIYLKMFEKLSA